MALLSILVYKPILLLPLGEKGFPSGSVVKKPCQCRRHRKCKLNPWVRKIPREANSNLLSILAWKFHGQRSLVGYSPLGHKESVSGGSVVKNPPANGGDTGSIPGSERRPEEGNGNPLQYSCLGNPWTEEPNGLQSMGLQRSQTHLSNQNNHHHILNT